MKLDGLVFSPLRGTFPQVLESAVGVALPQHNRMWQGVVTSVAGRANPFSGECDDLATNNTTTERVVTIRTLRHNRSGAEATATTQLRRRRNVVRRQGDALIVCAADSLFDILLEPRQRGAP